jgi:hypothetical protein
MSRVQRLTFALALVAGAACGSSPTSPTDAADDRLVTPARETFSGIIVSGTTSRVFSARTTGLAVARLSGITPAAALGIGLGIPRDSGSCLLARSTTSADGLDAEVSAAVELGTFCVQVFAPPTSTTEVRYTVTLEYP